VIWSYSYRPDVWSAVVTVGLVVCLGPYSWRRRHIAGAGTFAFSSALCGIWTLGRILDQQEVVATLREREGLARVTVDRNGSRARIAVEDNGHGFGSSRLKGGDGSHFGLTFMRERLQQIGGSLEIDSKPGAGTMLTLHVPTRDHGRETGEGSSG